MSPTILETLQNANHNFSNTSKGGEFGVLLAKEQLHNAVTLLEKGYSLNDEADSLIDMHGSVDDVPNKDFNIEGDNFFVDTEDKYMVRFSREHFLKTVIQFLGKGSKKSAMDSIKIPNDSQIQTILLALRTENALIVPAGTYSLFATRLHRTGKH